MTIDLKLLPNCKRKVKLIIQTGFGWVGQPINCESFISSKRFPTRLLNGNWHFAKDFLPTAKDISYFIVS
jgi:hypothetical protein